MEAEVLGKKVNRGGGYGLEIPVRYYFLGPAKPRCRIFCAKALDWLKRKLETG